MGLGGMHSDLHVVAHQVIFRKCMQPCRAGQCGQVIPWRQPRRLHAISAAPGLHSSSTIMWHQCCSSQQRQQPPARQGIKTVGTSPQHFEPSAIAPQPLILPWMTLLLTKRSPRSSSNLSMLPMHPQVPISPSLSVARQHLADAAQQPSYSPPHPCFSPHPRSRCCTAASCCCCG